MENFAGRELPEAMIRDFTRMILEGLVSIHHHGYVHCDLKSDNLLVFPSRNSSYELKISDFGNCLSVGEVPDYWGIDSPFVGTPIYMPPESLRDGVARKTLDLWSVGCLVLEMYTGVVPWEGVKLSDLKARLLDGEAPEIPDCVPCDARNFIETCFSSTPEERGSACELLFHRFLRRLEEEEQTVAEERRNSILLKLKLRIRRASKNVTEKKEKPLKLMFLPSKPPQLKSTLNRFLRLKIMPMKRSGSNLVSVQ
ncbi:unnamed protein product [Thlaspi arvense]|nr:unnamed protein product [Thlaspi arvense]